MMKLSSIGPYRWFANAYVELFRGLPALVVLFMVAFGIPNAFPGFSSPVTSTARSWSGWD